MFLFFSWVQACFCCSPRFKDVVVERVVVLLFSWAEACYCCSPRFKDVFVAIFGSSMLLLLFS